MKEDFSNIFSEVLDMINYVEQEYKDKIPKSLMEMFYEECNKSYLKKLSNENIEMKDKKYSEDALAIIAYLNLKYWCKDNKEKRKYRDMYFKNIK